MTALVALGLRLIRAGGALRLVSVLVGCALAVALLSVAWAVPDALYPILDPTSVDSRREPLVALLRCITVPLVALVFVVGRLSAQVRDRRLGSLRLLGVPQRQVAVVAVVENLVPSTIGSTLGIVGALALCSALTGPLGDRLEAPLAVDTWQAAAVAVAVVTLSVTLSLAPLRTIGSPRAARTSAALRKPSLWRLTPLVPCLSAFALLLTKTSLELRDWLTILFLVALVSGVLAIMLGIPLVSYATAGGLVRSGRTDLLLAGRGIQTQAASIGRRVVALGLAVFVVVGAAGTVAVYEGVTYLHASIHQMEVGPQVIDVWTATDAELTPAFVAELSAIDGVQAAIPKYTVDDAACSPGAVALCESVFVGTCEQLAALIVSTGCRDDQPAWIDADIARFEDQMMHATRVDSIDATGSDGVSHPVRLDATIVQDVPATSARWVWPGQDQVFLPVSLVESWGIAPNAVSVVADVGPEVRARVKAVADEHGSSSDSTAEYDYDSVITTRTTVWTVMTIAVAIALLAYGLATVDRAREMRRPRARLVALGIPARLLRRVDGTQNLVPLVAAIAAAACLGLVYTAAYAHMADQRFTLSPTLVLTLIGLVLLGGGLVSCATLPLTRSRIRASDLRDD